jgi:hypothetical protein
MKKKILVTVALFIGLSLFVYSGVRPSAAASPERWEYHTISCEPYKSVAEALPAFNKFGSEGWEFVALIPSRGGEAIFKRKLR